MMTDDMAGLGVILMCAAVAVVVTLLLEDE